ncbi:helix-turn-helix domain-containing protein [Clostridium butyricum]|uniref:Transcriptional regulator, Cro/CI family n=1 Tax=Clostridium butyricum E4 str. BoNT E BL5262 TaxID=632245 RepID=C4IHJ1_CLOBU|nr:helix-turn-helix domain-containing protein [Clostridium butyricum]EEP54286.1 transcriptional regulator, Cro/CI family [Clostridium butyricum E4 str. BoNT E BL5262]NFL30586.1 helix-turn-helix domain-containing protein [Clostridium butyricum]NFS19540.1 helix-turn-helix domain-containing protein [Clostridium butyricum]
MNINNIIKSRRLELGLTYEELGKKIGVGKSTVRKWETGLIENIKRDNIIALSKALDISPSIIMGWDDTNSNELSETHLSESQIELLNIFNKLNQCGKNKLIEYGKDLSDKYNNENTILTLAAHDDNLDKKTAIKNLHKAKAIFKQMDKE